MEAAENLPPSPQATATPSLATRLTSVVPAWLDTSVLAAEQFYLPVVPPGQGDQLRAAAKLCQDALAPSSYQDRKDILRGLRISTVPRNESADEARLSFEKLIADLSDVPADILREACKRYVNAPGTRFFPKGAGELRTFIQPLKNRRARDAFRLRELAKASDEAFDESDRCTPEAAAEIMAEFGLKQNPLGVFRDSEAA
jgi:hypothetical protein